MSQLKNHVGPFVALSQRWRNMILKNKSTLNQIVTMLIYISLSVFGAKTTCSIPADPAVCLKSFFEC